MMPKRLKGKGKGGLLLAALEGVAEVGDVRDVGEVVNRAGVIGEVVVGV